MKLTPKQIGITTTAGITGLFAGALLISGGIRIQLLSLAGLLALPPIAVTLIVADTRAQGKINQAEAKANEALRSLDGMTIKLTASEEKEARSQLELAEVQTSLNRAKELLKACEVERSQSAEVIGQQYVKIDELQAALISHQEQIEQLEVEIEAWEEEFHGKVDVEAEKRFQVAKLSEIKRIEAENDSLTKEAIEIAKQYRQWANLADARLQDRREFVENITSSYNSKISDFGQSYSKQVSGYLEQIEILNCKVAALQQKLQGDLIQPEYLQCGFDQNGRIANALAEWLWNHHKIPLKVTGFEVSDGVITAGYLYSRSTTPEVLAKVIEGESFQIVRSLGLYAIEKPTKLQIADVFTVKIRRDRPARKADKGSLYRSRDEFIKYILSQPVRLRIVGEPGAGKTPTTAVLLSHVLKRGFLNANTPNGQKLPYCIVEVCNPLANISVKNGDELDFCLKWSNGAKGFKGLGEEYRFRKNPDNAEYKNSVGYIWVADEIDNTMADLTKDEAKPFKDALKDGGHVNIGVIVMGQSANVSTSKGLSIDDQKMMTNIYIDAVSIRTFLTQYGERFYSKKAVEKALATLEELELEIEEQNEIICDTAREFRIAMVTANRSPVFYQLPHFDSVDIDVEAYQQILDKVSEIRSGMGETPTDASVSTHSQDAVVASASERRDVSGRPPYAGLETGRDVSDKPTCPYCGSSDIRSKGNSWLCQNLEHSNLAPNKPKSWKK
jgi:hypothetical protein